MTQGDATKDETYEFAKAQYLSDAATVRTDIVSFAVAIIGAVRVLFQKGIVTSELTAKLTFLGAISTIGANVVSKVFRLQHWRLVICDRNVGIDYRSSWCGKVAQTFFYIAIGAMACTLVLFLMVILQ
jgi:uncharacterized membrane protein